MMLSTILTVCRKELIDHLRDKRTATMIFVLSILNQWMKSLDW